MRCEGTRGRSDGRGGSPNGRRRRQRRVARQRRRRSRECRRTDCGRRRAIECRPDRSNRQRRSGRRPAPVSKSCSRKSCASANRQRCRKSGKISRSCRATIEPGFGSSSSVARRNSMPYFSRKPSTWPWPSIGRPGRVANIVATPKYLSPSPNWSTAVRLVRVVHEVHVALQDLRIEVEGLPDDGAVFGVLLVAAACA